MFVIILCQHYFVMGLLAEAVIGSFPCLNLNWDSSNLIEPGNEAFWVQYPSSPSSSSAPSPTHNVSLRVPWPAALLQAWQSFLYLWEQKL